MLRESSRTWALSISIKYMRRSRKSLHPSKTLLLAQSHPQGMKGERMIQLSFISPVYATTRHKSKTIALVNKITHRYRYKLYLNSSPSSLLPFFQPAFLCHVLRRVRLERSFPFSRRLCVSLAGNTSGTTLLGPDFALSPLSPPPLLGLDSAIELQKRMPAAAAADSDGYNTLVFHDQLRSIERTRLYGELSYPGTFGN